jgi:plasmid stability protein
LTINFTEFPLRSLAAAHGRSVEAKTQAEIVVQRIQTRLREPKIDLVVKDRTAILSGTVATDRQRDLAESMLRFEPGIDVVQNEIIVVKLP